VLSSGAEVVIPCYRGARGHPIALSALAATRLLADRTSPHLRAALEVSGLSTEEVEVRDPQILAVLNTPREFGRWLTSGSRGAPKSEMVGEGGRSGDP
jgi:CTP:molybdopterin cytidylyltransferase MocA